MQFPTFLEPLCDIFQHPLLNLMYLQQATLCGVRQSGHGLSGIGSMSTDGLPILCKLRRVTATLHNTTVMPPCCQV